MIEIRDKHGNLLADGDLVRVDHFVAARRRQHCYMWQIVRVKPDPKGIPRWYMWHDVSRRTDYLICSEAEFAGKSVRMLDMEVIDSIARPYPFELRANKQASFRPGEYQIDGEGEP